jgi:stage III sporulation protein SpoIIIAA
MTQRRITDDLNALLGVLPASIAAAVTKINNNDELLEIVIDLGRHPVARYVAGDTELSESEATRADIDFVIERIGDFDADNRAGLERTLHRISGMRNRRSHIIGLTCRVGRAVYGTIDIIQDLIESGKNVLILGKPGIGKTTILREAARILSENKRVIIVDTSNEIGGDGDVPHPAVGRARRMQVAKPSMQHEVMIEAVENHNPEVIVIDEIGRELEAAAARTIAERGVQLIGTAHGRTLENLLLNPTLSDLVGGIEAVTLSDDEARRRGTQKTVLERRAPPTFDVLIEIMERDKLAIQVDVATAVDALVRSTPLEPEIRSRDANGVVHIQKAPTPSVQRPGFIQPTGEVGKHGFQRITQSGGMYAPEPGAPSAMGHPANRPAQPSHRSGPAERLSTTERGLAQLGIAPQRSERSEYVEPARMIDAADEDLDEGALPALRALSAHGAQGPQGSQGLQAIRVFPYGVARNRLMQSAKRIGVPAVVVRELGEADALLTLRAYYRGRQQTILEAEQRGLPIYVLRANTNSQIEQLLAELFNLAYSPSANDEWDETSLQTQAAIQMVMNGERYVDLPPASPTVRRMQHELARQAQLVSQSFGKEPNRRVRIYRE